MKKFFYAIGYTLLGWFTLIFVVLFAAVLLIMLVVAMPAAGYRAACKYEHFWDITLREDDEAESNPAIRKVLDKFKEEMDRVKSIKNSNNDEQPTDTQESGHQS
jgi:hypothetical protein